MQNTPRHPFARTHHYDLLGQRHSAGRCHQKERVKNAMQIEKANGQRIKLGRLALFVLFIAGEILFSMTSLRAKLPTSAPCSASEYHEFDFWLGDWDAYDAAEPAIVVARTRVHRILDGCILREEYEGTNGLKGQSLTLYDRSRRIWHQSWVTNGGQLLVIEGGLEGGEMVLAGADHAADGKERHVRGTWKSMNGGVRETAVSSSDGGKTWQPWFDLVFRRHSSVDAANASGNDGIIVKALDAEYQEAVKKNDAATMDRLLADNFVLVTGSGKTYTKADLLQEARSGRVVYEHQEDTAQTVRLWGDTAAVTAKLWEKGTENGKPFDYTVWFTDTYVRTATGWCYVFGQSSLPLPKAPE
jgi:ketosteroid isomerase-like protein